MPNVHGERSSSDQYASRRIDESLLAIVEDPRARGQFLPLLAERHRPVRGQRGAAQRCSCGEPYLTCPVATQIRPLLAGARPSRYVGASHWFG